jgi:uncharacterized protein with GYD domain
MRSVTSKHNQAPPYGQILQNPWREFQSRRGQSVLASSTVRNRLIICLASGFIQLHPGLGEETTTLTFIVTLNWTDQGIRAVKEAPKRIQAARERAKKFGVEIKQVFLTSGQSDLLVIMETANGDNIAKFALMSGADGNVRSRTVRAWPETEMVKLISELP